MQETGWLWLIHKVYKVIKKLSFEKSQVRGIPDINSQI